MKYRATFRKINESDICTECPFIPEIDEFKTHIQAIFQDIEAIDGVSKIKIQTNQVIFITTDNLNIEALKSELKPILQNEFQYARLLKIEAV